MSKKRTSLVPVKLDLIDPRSIPDAGHTEMVRREEYQKNALKKFWRNGAVAGGSGVGAVWLISYLLGAPVSAIGTILAGAAGGILCLALVSGLESIRQFFRLSYGSAHRWLSRDINKQTAGQEGDLREKVCKWNLAAAVWNEAVDERSAAEAQVLYALRLLKKEVELVEERGETERLPSLRARVREIEQELKAIRKDKKDLLVVGKALDDTRKELDKLIRKLERKALKGSGKAPKLLGGKPPEPK